MVAKRLKDAHRHIIVDSRRLLMRVLVSEANASERLGATVVLDEAKEKLSRLEAVWVDQGYSGKKFGHAVKQVCGE
jgi:transposase